MSIKSKESMFNFVRNKVKQEFGYDADNLLNKSKLLRDMKTQTKLGSFF